MGLLLVLEAGLERDVVAMLVFTFDPASVWISCWAVAEGLPLSRPKPSVEASPLDREPWGDPGALLPRGGSLVVGVPRRAEGSVREGDTPHPPDPFLSPSWDGRRTCSPERPRALLTCCR